ncbi:MAG: hypothetical protein ACYCSQ_05130 [bacterium]
MKTIKIMVKNLRNKPASIIAIAILFAMIMFTVTVTSGCCAGWDCGPYYYGPTPGWHGNGGWNGNNGEHRGNGGYNGDH